ncbi:zinc-finger homeodomain protein 2 [Selaginella moellendorffii]|uniref:zinc-finger homeodomain protein 2 n=1 Tax=Selaginella moellendorffii TaxID=88036 RepID=UPI000D1CBC34|nr:zinc-finger homeodomain protein 2 [Selaginella moellendorffii]XP_024526922.1 zinc-finger homeodomain protein 2 [Selaginella moellendorffii]XP_024526923.1 zinc-finger homeodomain protein 2 [Selaginella moellendorffii]XP_024526924.1 zinc-finger homeodomain protein 2 [Selaginella moellendorffii]XP_024526925.1 zinc-finger homeodomain protein 2 [Selaginella moellendorffii]XP_024526926.1 zinc-finger homeodomain protein 2 [Selaginella moellendorffii]XP_024526927.1 zinc-finger homeodomain protein |eukprot:XP_024526921.1 zinc-finger homeodomain protein 2 [Selaginella moellendorffii]
MDLGGHEEDIPIPISAQFSAAAIHETAAKLKLLASGNGTPAAQVGSGAAVVVVSGEAGAAAAAGGDSKSKRPVRYTQCLKNHAAGIGGHALDGCGEFMPCGEEGTLDALKCAACDCHRNFHRREVEGEPSCLECHHRKDKKRLMLPSRSGELDDQGVYMPNAGGPNLKKRFRTKFTGDQKERMLAFADKVGWKIQKHDEAEVQQFCNEVGVKRHVLKVWMHNNKHTLGKKM